MSEKPKLAVLPGSQLASLTVKVGDLVVDHQDVTDYVIVFRRKSGPRSGETLHYANPDFKAMAAVECLTMAQKAVRGLDDD